MISGKLTFQCTRNGPQNLPYCPGSIQDTFIIYSSISHQHIFHTYFASGKMVRNFMGPGPPRLCTRNVLQTLHIVQGLSRTPLLFIPRCLTNTFPNIFCKLNFENQTSDNLRTPEPRFTNKCLEKEKQMGLG